MTSRKILSRLRAHASRQLSGKLYIVFTSSFNDRQLFSLMSYYQFDSTTDESSGDYVFVVVVLSPAPYNGKSINHECLN